jgi:Anti-sigma-K factor rskA, C-terminal
VQQLPDASAHLDPEILSVRALGEPVVSSSEEAHLVSCVRCQSELDQLRGVVATARMTSPADAPQAPPPEVWSRIVAELNLEVGARDDSNPPAAERSNVITLRPRWRRGAALAAGAAGLVVVGAGLGGSIAALRDDQPPATPPPVATAALDPLDTPQASGQADLVQADANRTLEVSVAGLDPQPGSFFEVWLLDPTGTRLVSLGVLEGESGSFRLPETLDVVDYPVVDISIEPYDGNPAHSAVSAVRGTLSV